jgi:hypothetical protein
MAIVTLQRPIYTSAERLPELYPAKMAQAGGTAIDERCGEK